MANNETHIKITLFTKKAFFGKSVHSKGCFKLTRIIHNRISPNTTNIFTNA